MDWQIPVFVGVLVLLFVTWMYWEMAGNTDLGKLPPCFIRFSGDNRTDWIFAFVLLNVFTATYYYTKVYRPGRLR